MAETRIYRIDEIVEGSEATKQNPATPRRVVASFLIRAGSAAQAVRHAARRFKCEVATQQDQDLVDLCAKGTIVQMAGDNGDSDS
jgi:hypothetical protein